jgi:hypothetical protein
MQNNLQKIVNLIKKTGDKLVVYDSSKPSDTYVIMGLEDYESMVVKRSEVRGLTEDQLLDKINRDIAIWKSEQEIEKTYNQTEENRESSGFNSVGDIIQNPLEQKKKKRSWSIPSDRKQNAEEVIEEDRQYFEEINF